MTNPLEHLIGKKVFIFDTETTGIPAIRPNTKWGSRDQYFDYYNHDAYDQSRIISIAWYYTNNFSQDTLDISKVEYFIRKPDTFTEINNSHIHHITFDMAHSQGLDLQIILEQKKLEKDLIESDYIIAHNVMFDVHILLNELHRLNKTHLTTHILNLLDKNQCICSGEIGTPICKLEFPNSKYPKRFKQNYKMPKLSEFYKIVFNKDMENAHNAKGDVQALVQILSKI